MAGMFLHSSGRKQLGLLVKSLNVQFPQSRYNLQKCFLKELFDLICFIKLYENKNVLILDTVLNKIKTLKCFRLNNFLIEHLNILSMKL